MKKILLSLSIILLILILSVSCTNLPKKIIHTLNLKIPGLVQSFELAPFATETAEASIVSVLPGFRFITEDGTAMRLFYATELSIGYDDISDQLDVDIQELKDQASISSISTSVEIAFSEKLDTFVLPTIEASFTLPNFSTEGTSLTITFDKPEIDISIASETITVNRIYVATETLKALAFDSANISDGVIIKGGTIDITATNTSDATFTFSLKAENQNNVFAQSGEFNLIGGDAASGISARGGTFQVNLDTDDLLSSDATITFVSTALELPLNGGTLIFDFDIDNLEIQLAEDKGASDTNTVPPGITTSLSTFSIDTGLTDDATLTGGTLQVSVENGSDEDIDSMTIIVTNDRGDMLASVDLNNIGSSAIASDATAFSTPNLLGANASVTVAATMAAASANSGDITVTATFNNIQIQIANPATFNAETVEFDPAPDFGFNEPFIIEELATDTGRLSVNPATLTLAINGQAELDGLGLDLDILLNDSSVGFFDLDLGLATQLIIDLSNTVFTRNCSFTINATPYLAPDNSRSFFEGQSEFEPVIELQLLHGTDVILDTPIEHNMTEIIETGLDSDFTFESVTLNGDLVFDIDIQTLPDGTDYSATVTIKESFGTTIVATPVNNGKNTINLNGKTMSATDLELKFDFSTADAPIDINFDTTYDASVTAETNIGISDIANLTLKAEDSTQRIDPIDDLIHAQFQSADLNISISSDSVDIAQRLLSRGINLDTFGATMTTEIDDYLIEFTKTGDDYIASLADVELTGAGATLTLGSLSIEFTDEDALNLPNQIDIAASMTNVVFREVTVDVSSYYNDLMIEQSESFDIPGEAKDYLKAIVLSGDPKVKIEWFNNTPVELSLNASISNDILNEQVRLSNTGTQASTTWIDIPGIITVEGLSTIGFDFEASPSGLDSVNHQLTVNNFVFDDLDNYRIAATVTFKDFSEEMMPRGENIVISEVVLFGEVNEQIFEFMRNQLPDFWIDYAGQIQIDDAMTQAWVELDEKVLTENPELSATLTISGTPSGIIISEIPINLAEKTHFESSINEFLSNPSTDLTFGINAHIDEATINLDNITEDATDLFEASVTVNIPVRFKISEDISLLNDTINLEEQLNLELSDLDAVLDMIQSATAIVHAVNNSGVSVKFELRWDSAAGEPIITNTQGGALITLNNGENSDFTIALGSGKDAKDLLEKDIYAHIILPDSNDEFYTVLGDSAIELSIYLDTVVKVEIPLASAK